MSLCLRGLASNDLDKGLLELLSQLTVVGDVDRSTAEGALKEILALHQIYKVVVIEDASIQKIVATAKLMIERKLTRGCGMCGHIEDVVVDKGYQGQKLGRRVVDALVSHAKSAGCYKVILDCSEQNMTFYQKCGFEKKEAQMALYL